MPGKRAQKSPSKCAPRDQERGKTLIDAGGLKPIRGKLTDNMNVMGGTLARITSSGSMIILASPSRSVTSLMYEPKQGRRFKMVSDKIKPITGGGHSSLSVSALLFCSNEVMLSSLFRTCLR